jgi:glycosyltransferase involved in cell wall biosynthesis
MYVYLGGFLVKGLCGGLVMRVVFAHDAVFSRELGTGLYFNERFNYALWERYLRVFDEVTVVGRLREIPAGEQQRNCNDSSLSSGPNVSFTLAPSISGPVRMITARRKAAVIIEGALMNADALIARLPSELGLLAISVARKLGKPWAVEVVGNAWDSLWYYGNWQGKVYAPILHNRVKKAIRDAQYALYVTDKYLQACYPCNGVTTNCSNVELSWWDDEAQRFARRASLIENQKPPFKVGIIAFMEAKYKGIDTALKALYLIKDRVDIELRVLGGGNYRPWLAMAEKLGIADRVRFYGSFPPGEAVFRWIDDLDLYIQPSKTEGLPRALIEAMSRAIPAIGARVGGIPELLSSDCIFNKGDYRQLSRLILRVLFDKRLQQELSKKNMERARAYTKVTLDTRRTEFWRAFMQSI